MTPAVVRFVPNLKAEGTSFAAPLVTRSQKEPETRRRAVARCRSPLLQYRQSRTRRQRSLRSKIEWPSEACKHLFHQKDQRPSFVSNHIIRKSTHDEASSSPDGVFSQSSRWILPRKPSCGGESCCGGPKCVASQKTPSVAQWMQFVHSHHRQRCVASAQVTKPCAGGVVFAAGMEYRVKRACRPSRRVEGYP